MFGKKRTNMSRLLETGDAGAETIKVSKDVDWAANDRIFIAASTMQHD